MIHWLSKEIHRDPMDMLWHYSCGEMSLYPDRSRFGDKVAWSKYSRRGVQFLGRIRFPRKQKRYIFSPQFELRIDRAFDEVLLGCADPGRDAEGTWLIPELIEGYRNLHRLGYAHSFEAWEGERLAGGALVVQIGGFLACNSMFHRVSNASKAAWGRALVHLKERGFEWIDTNGVSPHLVQYGEEWVAQGEFERMLNKAMSEHRTISDQTPCPRLPRWIQIALAARSAAARVVRKLRRPEIEPQRGGFAHSQVSRQAPRIPS